MSKVLKTELKEFDAASLTGSYQNFGAALSNAAIKIQFINASDVDVYVTDGTSVWRVAAEGTVTFDEQFMRNDHQGSRIHVADQGQLQIKQVTAAGTGSIWAHVVVER